MWVVLCNAEGIQQLGSDGIVWVKRYGSPQQTAREYRDRFKANFPHKWEGWTHFAKVYYFFSIPAEGFKQNQLTKID